VCKGQRKADTRESSPNTTPSMWSCCRDHAYLLCLCYFALACEGGATLQACSCVRETLTPLHATAFLPAAGAAVHELQLPV
jgi:hypothetical protein